MAPIVSDKVDPLFPDADPPPVMVHVVAPATLPAGYTFDAQVSGDPDRTFTVEVPSGGVNEGDYFLAPLPENFDGPRLVAPTGRWKDGLFGCCNYGCCHAHLWCAICCPQILMGSVMARMNLTWLGEPGPYVSTRTTFKVVLTLVIAYMVYASTLGIISDQYDIDTVPGYVVALKTLGSVTFSLWALYALCKTRENVRAKYSIAEERCAGCEDCCCAFWCTCCTVAQMARHTGEYETYNGTCCTETGLPKGTPMLV